MKKIVCIGDSLTYGFGAYDEDAWPYVVSKKLGIECINRGINGECTSGMAARFRRDVWMASPDAVVILGGSNDILNGWLLERTMSFVQEMIDMAREASLQTIIGIPMCIDIETLRDEGFPEPMAMRYVQKFGDYRTKLLAVCQQENIPYVDFYDLYPKYMSMEGHKEWYIDGVHPTRAGYHMMAEIMCETLRQII